MKKLSVFFCSSFVWLSCMANVTMPGLFGDNMVLQRNKPIAIWGWATPNEKVTIQFKKQVKTVLADKQGNWSVKLTPETAGGPFSLAITGNNAITFANVLIGEVWICSGQSNMEWQLRLASNAQDEVAAANFSQIRHFTVSKAVSTIPQKNIKGGSWKICNPENSAAFTAVGYFFAKQLYQKLKVPIGLINNAWGGTHIETWTSRSAFENSEEFKSMINDMPIINMDSMNHSKVDIISAKMKGWKGELLNKSLLSTWTSKDFDDSNWEEIKAPALWENQGLEGLDGVVLFRKTFVIDAKDAGKETTIQLAKIDDNDVTYLNGNKIGSTEGYNMDRKYVLPKGLLKAGENVLAVRVDDTGGGGGFYGDDSEMTITLNENKQSLAGTWRYKLESFSENISAVLNPNEYPTLLFNAMLFPLIPFGIQGVIWYQGESNTARAYQYRKAFPLMINDWRKHFKQGDFPFYYVQLASFDAGGSTNKMKAYEWAELREAQSLTLSVPNTGMVVTTDIGDTKDIHPRNKMDVGKRLALVALKNTYKQDVVSNGPVFKAMKAEADKIIVSFSNGETGLMIKGTDGVVNGFEIAGQDQNYVPAKAILKNNQVVVFAESIKQPVAIRFGWTDDAGTNNLFNKAGLPVVPFRTDAWDAVTTKQKFNVQK